MTGGPTVRNAYLVVDAVLLLFAGVRMVEALRLRGWSRRLGGARHQRLALLPSFLVEVLLPLSVLVVLPLWISTMGITPALNLLGTWAVAMWTLPDIGVSLLSISTGLLIVGAVQGLATLVASSRRTASTPEPCIPSGSPSLSLGRFGPRAAGHREREAL